MTTLKLRADTEGSIKTALESVGLYDEESGYRLSSANHELVVLGPTPTGPLIDVDDGEGGTISVASMDNRFHADLYDREGIYTDALAAITVSVANPYHKIAGIE